MRIRRAPIHLSDRKDARSTGRPLHTQAVGRPLLVIHPNAA
ncbi:hypothetical protein BURCENBC7_AP1958 [Burkholderia cenocepacia BC7]|nr:hypothetical protein BURCENK562V_C7126 [Burkholderia cenocepacia K56-2Valvano]ERI29356.1 hypothetical protein BURCENBC7_AP1958 [Burkholderia cenocepacia BC7]